MSARRELSVAIRTYNTPEWIVLCSLRSDAPVRATRSGLATALIEHALQEDGLRNAPLAQIVTLIGNDAADRAYRRAGFSPGGESHSVEFESATGVPGLRRYVREPI